VLLVDDWIETGSQARAARQLIEACGGELLGVSTIVTQATDEVVAQLGRAHALVSADELP
jgi:adenine phosphoribosyltransferase